MKLLAFLFVLLSACHANAEYTCQSCVQVLPTATATAIATSTATPNPTATATPLPTATATPNPIVTINFAEDTQIIFPSVGVGFQSTQRPLNEVSNPRGIPSTSEVFRWYMHETNSAPGVFNWSLVDAAKNKAVAQGQTLNVGWIAFDPYGGSWLRNHIPGTMTRCTEEGGGSYFAPDFNSPTTQQRHKEFVEAFAARYGDDPAIEHVDARSWGSYGENHHYCQVVTSTGAPLPLPSTTARALIIKHYNDALPNKLKVVILDDVISRTEGKRLGMGWRADCFGGINHEGTLYPQWLNNPDMKEVWRDAPVLLEPCGALSSTSYPIATKIDQIIAKHASLINTKNGFNVPENQWSEWQRLLRKLGYRFVLRRAVINQGLTLHIENVGIAPNYKPLRVENATTGVAVTLSKVMPGETRLAVLPGNVGDVIRFSMDGKVVRTANQTWNNGVLLQ